MKSRSAAPPPIASSYAFQILLFSVASSFLFMCFLAFSLVDRSSVTEADLAHGFQQELPSEPSNTVDKKSIRFPFLPSRHQVNDFFQSSVKRGKRAFSSASEPYNFLEPKLEYLPPFPSIDNVESLIADTLENNRPTLAGIVGVLNQFIADLRASNQALAAQAHSTNQVRSADIRAAYFALASKHLVPLDKALQKSEYPKLREDGSVFMSLAAFRERILADTMRSAFNYSSNPDKLFVGAVVQNCFGGEGLDACKTGYQVVDKKKNIRQMLDAPSDKNGIEIFCSDPEFAKYCEAGQIRVLYMHETEAIGPATARYLASKLWGGENYYVQVDAHLQFAQGWDELYIKDLHLARAFPYAILSTYPPGFVNFRQEPPYTRGTRICNCHFSQGEGNILRVEMNGRCKENETRPTQMPFAGAGFVFAHAQLLRDVPYDPYLPWCFMGEEIAYSIRAWTSGWSVYAPRLNLIGHHYRPLKLGLPHYWETVDRLFPGQSDNLMSSPRKRIKNLVGYPMYTKAFVEKECQKELRQARNFGEESLYEDPEFYSVLHDLESYGLGTNRTLEEYLKFAEIDYKTHKCGDLKWCSEGEVE